MATKYLRCRINFVISDASDYSNPSTDKEIEITASGNEQSFIVMDRYLAGTAAQTISLNTTAQTDPLNMLVYNSGPTNFVSLAYDTVANTSTTLKIPAGECAFITDIDEDTNPTLTADTAAVSCFVAVW